MNLRRLIQLSSFLAMAVVLGYVESFIPTFLPGVKFGLANAVILIVLLYYSWWEAFLISILRVFLVSLLCGSIFQFGFFVSLSGAILSLGIMSLLRLILKDHLGVYGLSAVGSFFHVVGQVAMVYILTSFNAGTFYYLPWLLLISLPTGLLIGFLVSMIGKTNLLGTLKRDKAAILSEK